MISDEQTLQLALEAGIRPVNVLVSTSSDLLCPMLSDRLLKFAALVRNQWRPISEAPKDGTQILVYIPGIAESMHVVHWGGRHIGRLFTAGTWAEGWIWYEENLGHNGYPPTHWMPLPTPPGDA